MCFTLRLHTSAAPPQGGLTPALGLMKGNWPFDQARNVAAISTRQVMREGAPILYVAHHLDDHSWTFLDAGVFDTEDALVVGMGEVVAIDSSLFEIADLPPGWVAVRDTISQVWLRRQDTEA